MAVGRARRRLGLLDRVRFAGRVADEDLPAYYDSADAVVLPSIAPTETFGVVQLEAMAAGRPVVTQDTGFGIALPTGEGLFAFNTMEDIITAFEAIHADYDRHSRAARRIAEEYFRAETVLAKVIDDLGL